MVDDRHSRYSNNCNFDYHWLSNRTNSVKIPQYEVAHRTDSYPSGLKNSDEMSEAISGGLSSERILELADSGYMPHYRIDSGAPLFKVTEVKAWISENAIVKVSGRSISEAMRIVVAAPEVIDTPPIAIANISSLQQIPKWGYQPGIYFLCLKGEVVYVGQSITPAGRISAHRTDKEKNFDTVYLLPVPQSELNDVEAAFIHHLLPKQQGHIKNGREKPCSPRMSKPKEQILECIFMQQS